jgi:hypothetical protein
MEVLSTITEIIRDLLIFVAVMTALLIILLVIVFEDARQQRTQTPTHGVNLPGGRDGCGRRSRCPVEPIPGIDALYDFAVPILLIWYWFTFFRDAWRMSNHPSRRGSGRLDVRVDDWGLT